MPYAVIRGGMATFEEMELGSLAQRRAPVSKRAKGKTNNQAAADAIEKQPASVNSSAGDAPAFDEIQLRAYCIHVERGGRHGCDLDDWIQAERELTEEHAAGPSGNDGAR
jgi:Protein of unknown function (DUF2934)